MTDPMPRSRTSRLIVRELPDESVVYDLDRHNVFCLNRTALLVWQHCDGATSIASIADALASELGFASVAEDVVVLALSELSKAHLLEEGAAVAIVRGSTRREAIRRIGAAALLPIIVGFVAPTPAEAESCCSAVTGAFCIGCPEGTTCGKHCSKVCKSNGRCG